MKFSKILTLLLCLTLTAESVLFVHAAGVTEDKVVLKESFDAAAGTNLRSPGWNGWAQDNVYQWGTDDSSITIAEETGGNFFASFKKTSSSMSDGKRVWIAKSLNLPQGTNQVTASFKIRSVGVNDGRFDIGFKGANDTNVQWGDGNSCVGLWLGSSENHVRLCDNTNSGRNLLKNDDTWEEIKIVLDYVSGYIRVYINGALAHAKDLSYETSVHHHIGDELPGSIGFGWHRNVSNAEAHIDDLSIIATVPVPFAILDTTQKENIDIDKPLELTFSNSIDPASLPGARLVLEGSDTTVLSREISGQSGSTLRITFDKALAYDTEYKLLLSGLKDIGGQPPETPEFTFRTRPRKLLVNPAKFYTNYNEQTQTLMSTFAGGNVTSAVEFQNEKDTASAVGIMALYNGNKLINVTCEEANMTTGQTGQIELSMDTTGGTKAVVMVWDSLSDMNPMAAETVLDASGVSNPVMAGAAGVTALTAEADYDTSEIKMTAAGAAGTAGFYILRPGYTVSGLTTANINSALGAVGQLATDGTAVYDYSEMQVTPGRYEHTVALGGKDVSLQLFDSYVVTGVLDLIKTADAGRLLALLDETKEEVLTGGYRLNDVLCADLTDYNALLDKAPALSQIAGKTFASIAACKTAFYNAVSEQKGKEVTVVTFLDSVNAADWSGLEQLFKDNSDLLTLNWTGTYADLSGDNQIKLYKHLAEDYTFNKLKEIKDAFDHWASALAVVYVPPKTPSGGGGGGGGSRLEFEAGIPETEPKNPDSAMFTDCQQVGWALEAIKSLAKQNIISGTGNGLFEPAALVTREQFVKILVNAFNIKDSGQKRNFLDVPADAWYSPYVLAAYNSGVVRGVSDDEFGTEKQITRADMAVLCMRAMQYKGINISPKTKIIVFADEESIPDYAIESVNALSAAGLISGVGGNYFAPQDYANRAMAAKLIYDILQEQ